jgi:methionine biosynthesis protein MetW
MNTTTDNSHPEYDVIVSLVNNSAVVLDLGCGDGELLCRLKKEKNVVKATGIEIDEQSIYRCVARGLSVFQGDIDSGLTEYEDKSFDYVILNQSFQQVKKPDIVLGEALRVGKKVIVGFPNFAYFTARFYLGIRGVAPVTRSLPYQWYDTPNLHFLSIADFIQYCRKRNITIEKAYYVDKRRRIKIFPNLLALVGVFLISKPAGT